MSGPAEASWGEKVGHVGSELVRLGQIAVERTKDRYANYRAVGKMILPSPIEFTDRELTQLRKGWPNHSHAAQESKEAS